MSLRPSIRYIANHFTDRELIGVEVGVYLGKHARLMLNKIPNLKMLYLVDPYVRYEGFIRSYPVPMEKAKAAAIVILEKHKDRIHWVYEMFDHGQIPEKVDFVYIDGNHTYKYVKHDIEVAESIIQPWGVICGHNYQKERPGVIQAVDEYSKRTGCKLKVHRGRTEWRAF